MFMSIVTSDRENINRQHLKPPVLQQTIEREILMDHYDTILAPNLSSLTSQTLFKRALKNLSVLAPSVITLYSSNNDHL